MRGSMRAVFASKTARCRPVRRSGSVGQPGTGAAVSRAPARPFRSVDRTESVKTSGQWTGFAGRYYTGQERASVDACMDRCQHISIDNCLMIGPEEWVMFDRPRPILRKWTVLE